MGLDVTILGQAVSGTQLALGAIIVLVSVIVGRLLQNSLPGNRPPVFEGVPFIGGLMKFVGVSVQMFECQRSSTLAVPEYKSTVGF